MNWKYLSIEENIKILFNSVKILPSIWGIAFGNSNKYSCFMFSELAFCYLYFVPLKVIQMTISSFFWKIKKNSYLILMKARQDPVKILLFLMPPLSSCNYSSLHFNWKYFSHFFNTSDRGGMEWLGRAGCTRPAQPDPRCRQANLCPACTL